MKLNHSDLIKLAHILGYTSLSDKGICYGFSVMLGQAFLVQDEESFFNRLVLIKSYKNNFSQLKQDIYQVNVKVINKKKINPNEKKLLEIPALFEGIALTLNPTNHRGVFNEIFISQFDLEKTYSFIASVKLESAEYPVSIVDSTNHIFDLRETTSYFTELESSLNESVSILPIFLTNYNHSVIVNYDKKKKKWIYVDTNHLDLDGQNKFYLELNSHQLSQQLFISFHCSKTHYISFHSTVISNNKQSNDKLLFESLNLKRPLSPKDAVKYDQHGVGLLYIACQHGDIELVKKLLKQPKVDINKATNTGATPLFTACQNGYVDIVKKLLKRPGIDINKTTNRGPTPLLIACQTGHIDIVTELLKRPGIDINKATNTGATPLSMACQNGHIDIVTELLKKPGIDINKARNLGATPLLVACQNGHIDIVTELLKKPGIDINKATNTGATPLYMACQNGHIDIVTELLKRPEIDINSGPRGRNPLSAVRHAPKQRKVIISLYLNIKKMECYGHSLSKRDKCKGQATIILANELWQRVDYLHMLSIQNMTTEDFNEFTLAFKKLLHSKDELMKEHRATWKPILANILLALTGIGLLAIALKFSTGFFNTSTPHTWSDHFFFSKTNSQRHVERIHQSLTSTPTFL